MFESIPTVIPTDLAAIACLGCVAIGILMEISRKRVTRWAHWKLFHAGVPFPGRRGIG